MAMNIYDFINSSDIREYLQKIDYQFTPTEAAWVIYNCRRLDVTMQDKHSAWDQIIRTMPDEDIPKRFNCAGFPSLHKFLMDLSMQARLCCRSLTRRYILSRLTGCGLRSRIRFIKAILSARVTQTGDAILRRADCVTDRLCCSALRRIIRLRGLSLTEITRI